MIYTHVFAELQEPLRRVLHDAEVIGADTRCFFAGERRAAWYDVVVAMLVSQGRVLSKGKAPPRSICPACMLVCGIFDCCVSERCRQDAAPVPRLSKKEGRRRMAVIGFSASYLSVTYINLDDCETKTTYSPPSYNIHCENSQPWRPQ